MKLNSIMMDGEPCTKDEMTADVINKITISNCKQILSKTYEVGGNVTIEILIKENYKFSMTRRVLTIESDLFT